MRFTPSRWMAAATSNTSGPLAMRTWQVASWPACMVYRGSVNRIDLPGSTSRLPLLPVKPLRYRRLGLKETSKASSLRASSPPDTVWRRASNSLSVIPRLPRENLGARGQSIGLAHIAAAPGSVEPLLDLFLAGLCGFRQGHGGQGMVSTSLPAVLRLSRSRC